MTTCGHRYPVARDDWGTPIVCDLKDRHAGLHEDHQDEDVGIIIAWADEVTGVTLKAL